MARGEHFFHRWSRKPDHEKSNSNIKTIKINSSQIVWIWKDCVMRGKISFLHPPANNTWWKPSCSRTHYGCVEGTWSVVCVSLPTRERCNQLQYLNAQSLSACFLRLKGLSLHFSRSHGDGFFKRNLLGEAIDSAARRSTTNRWGARRVKKKFRS